MNIYVGNLSWNLTEEDLSNLFAPYGEVVSGKIVTDKFNNNRSKGFGFVEMSSVEEANMAMNKLNGSQLGDHTIAVKEAKPQENRPYQSNKSISTKDW